ncbi:hypothetical protein FN976_24245 [Caenimonas sedimenti]|uniref:Uncharacterized protein n=1 Tax=Caenimonas sedimenti TaxID=2596921 RepID=A0A562ZIB6_9BURK|nr:hypothetical protein [Caenimonas sedimenti]TWO68055.1 hypothetical protein FN976_24245 [Caenimonas sedimenti]
MELKTRRARDDVQIVLGESWQRFAFATTGLVFLGTIRRGMEIGALAVDENGAYNQVNGDVHQSLNLSRVAAHLRKVGALAGHTHGLWTAEQVRSSVPVTVKRRRVWTREPT